MVPAALSGGLQAPVEGAGCREGPCLVGRWRKASLGWHLDRKLSGVRLATRGAAEQGPQARTSPFQGPERVAAPGGVDEEPTVDSLSQRQLHTHTYHGGTAGGVCPSLTHGKDICCQQGPRAGAGKVQSHVRNA